MSLNVIDWRALENQAKCCVQVAADSADAAAATPAATPAATGKGKTLPQIARSVAF